MTRLAHPTSRATAAKGRVRLQRRCSCGGCEHCRKRKPELQRRALAGGRALGLAELAPPVVHRVLRAAGRPLGGAVRGEMEARLGHDFRRVRIHDGPLAAESAAAVGAEAYAVGRHVAFGAARFAPQTAAGRELLAHELVHTLEQGLQDPSSGQIPVADSPASEARAERVAAGGSGAAVPISAAAPPSLARKPRTLSFGGLELDRPNLLGQEDDPPAPAGLLDDLRLRKPRPPGGLGDPPLMGAPPKVEIEDRPLGSSLPSLLGKAPPLSLPRRSGLLGDPSRGGVPPHLSLLDRRGLNRPRRPPFILPGSLRETLVLEGTLPRKRLELPKVELGAKPKGRGSGSFRLRPLPFAPVTLVPIARCLPDRPLNWGDFRLRSGSSNPGAWTSTRIAFFDVQGNRMAQAQLRRGSWVRGRAKLPTSRRHNGCARHVHACHRALRANPAGGSWTLGREPGCPAAILATGTARNSRECDTVIGARCDRAAVQDSARLLRHEQGHFDITCVVAGKANDALAAGIPSSWGPPTLPLLRRFHHWVSTAARRLLRRLHREYDSKSETDGGCDAAGQATWEQEIANGIPQENLQ